VAWHSLVCRANFEEKISANVFFYSDRWKKHTKNEIQPMFLWPPQKRLYPAEVETMSNGALSAMNGNEALNY
jgi:hypothetical protein